MERNPLTEESPLSQPLKWLTEQSLRAPGTVVGGALLVTLLAVLITANGLRFKTNRLDLLNPQSSYNQRWLRHIEEFDERDDAVIVVRAEDPVVVATTLEDLAAKLREQDQLFESIFYKRQLDNIKAKGLHFLSEQELQQLAGQVSQAAEIAEATTGTLDPAAALAQLNDQLERGPVPQARAQVEQQYGKVVGMLKTAMSGKASLTRSASEGVELNSPRNTDRLKELEPRYLTAEDGRMGFVLLRFKSMEDEFARGGKAVAALRTTIAATRTSQPKAWIGLTGMPVIEYDEMQASQADMFWTNFLSLIGVILLFVAGYGGGRHALLANCVLLVGTAWTFAYATLAIGHLNILSAAFAVILIGLGIDFGIHYVASYLRLRKNGHECKSALITTAADVGPGVVTGGVTAAAAFFMAGLTEFTGVRELGVISGGGILLCVLATIVVLPPLILISDEKRPVLDLPEILPAARWFQISLQKPRLVMAVGLAVTALIAAGLFHLRYDHNLLNLQARHVESVDIERDIFTSSDESVWFAVSTCNTREELRARKAKLEAQPTVAKTEEIVSLLPSSSPAKQRSIAIIHDKLVRLKDSLPTASPIERVAERRSASPTLAVELTRAARLLSRELPYESPTVAGLTQLAQGMSQVPPEQLREQMTALSTKASPAALAPLLALLDYAEPAPPVPLDIPRELTDRFVGKTGKHLLRVYAKGNIWEMDKLARFVADVEGVDPRITGSPVQTFYASRHMQKSYILAGVYSLLAVFGLLLVDFGTIRHSLLAMVPLALGFVQMCGIIGWLGIPFNPANLIALPLILGIGAHDGVPLVHEFRRQRGRFKLSDSTAVAVILTSTTTMASFGSMILARHQGLRSLGQVLTLGAFFCLASSMVLFPALLSWLSRNREEVGAEEDVAATEERISEEPAENEIAAAA
ncbi:MAG: MMPL family transporter [Pirellulaceae bacterium]